MCFVVFQLFGNFKQFRPLEKYNEVENASIAKFNALFSNWPIEIAKIKPREILPRQNREIKYQ